ncbi:hypothetical protein DYB25_008131 [Aphanomyces astaci]|uniref:deoxyribose-phosphate aldolase n=1 Tax=Aphanomyces astaci TaxID=112090 RepID=A0A397A9X4_APHAT|nr:hypothetical protein DYB25_008131 [Aphanomyces astaci]RHY53061.1 hypothetical protein DYB30_009999 [Aphanomyces astaci]RHY57510.1 hypothetical protein DYB38_003840 [Aphanomyces astaci]RHZ11289.1 hypothetical protein DYB26_008384 [Aphanomyces astaci]
MPRKKLAAWDEFDEIPTDENSQMKMGRMECKHCKGTVSKSAHRLLSHLQNCPNFEGDLPAAVLHDACSIDALKAESDASYHPLSKYIDHTLLKVLDGLMHQSLRRGCRRRHVKVCCVVGFPLGASATAVKAFEATQCLQDGADEIDMVIAVGKLKAGDHAYVLRDIWYSSFPQSNETLSHVILETALMTDPEIESASHLAIAAGADFIKTSTGFSTRGASIDDVMLMSRIAHPRHVQVKASGGVRTLEDAQKMVAAGATRLGTSGGIAITHGDDVAHGQY